MYTSVRKFISSTLAVSSALALSGLGVVATANAAQLTGATATLSNTQAAVASNYTFSFGVGSTTVIKGFKIQFRAVPSGSGTVPHNLSTAASTFGSVTTGAAPGTAATGWAYSGTPANGEIDITDATGTGALTVGNLFNLTAQNVTNNDLAGPYCGPSSTSSDTCYAQIYTYADTTLATLIDQTVVSYTVVAPTIVTATVDPSLTFTLAGVPSANIATNDTNVALSINAITAKTVTTTASTVPFANISVNVPGVAQQSMTVATNAQYGYTVYQKFTGTVPATDTMVGVNVANHFSPWTGTFAAPTTLLTATGTTPNTNTAFLGMRTTNANVPNFTTSNVYAGPYVGTGSGNPVMTSSAADSGATATFVTYKIVTNAQQPADTYTGTILYNVVAKY